MQFQHSTGLQPTLVQRVTQGGNSGTSITIIPAGDSTLTVDIQQYLFSWSGINQEGQFSVTSRPADPNPLVVFQIGADGNIVVPGQGEQLNIGTYGLRVSENASGGIWFVSVWYTLYQN